MQITNKKGLSLAWEDAVKNDDYDHVGDYSTTTLIGPPRIHFLTKKYDDKLREDVSDRIWMLFGSAIHYVLERAGESTAAEYSEKRMLLPFLDRMVSLKPDRVEPTEEDNHYSLHDFKVTSVYVYAKPVKFTWEAQTNLYAYALETLHGIVIDNISIEMLLRDWSRGDMLRKKSLTYSNQSTGGINKPVYPDANVQVMPVRKWSKGECEAYLTERVSLFKSCEGLGPDDLPQCSEQERWCNAGKWIVKSIQKGGKVSTKATPGGQFDTEQEAKDFIVQKERTSKTKTKYVKEYRASESKRCELYCPVSRYCDQYNTDINPDF